MYPGLNLPREVEPNRYILSLSRRFYFCLGIFIESKRRWERWLEKYTYMNNKKINENLVY